MNLVKGSEVIAKIRNTELNGAIAYKFGKALQVIIKELELYDISRQQIFQKYCVKDENNNIKITDGNVQFLPQFIKIANQQLKQLNQLEIELNISQLCEEDLQYFNLTPQEIMDIIWWIK